MNNTITVEKLSHTVLEDILAIVTGTLMISFAIIMLRQAGALTGGTVGLAFLIHYMTNISFGTVFFIVNLPFYYLAMIRMGWRFTLKTFCAVALVSVFSDFHLLFIHFDHLQPVYATLFGSLLIGLGLIVLFRHRCSLGGVNILTLFIQERYGIRAGKLQMVIDVTIVLASLFVVTPVMLLASVAGAIILNMIIAMNYRPGRYIG
ncbi:YitT family protein [Chromatiaceae bacterium AAb-1]|nr:YitT family protein [Chromatiaceae bacterium AAb-1]